MGEVALIGLSSGTAITLTVTAPATAGDDFVDGTDNSRYLQYSSNVIAGQTRTITANWAAGNTAPAGCSLRLEVTAINVPPGHQGGSPAGRISMSTTATPIVTGIGGCATGTAATSGAQLTYTLQVDTPGSLVAGASTTVTVTFTLQDDA